ncbi:MAG: alpha/beta hydrolase [Phenylobacterium sp.]
MPNLIKIAALAGAMSLAAATAGLAADAKPTVVLVHGAFAESSSWNGVVAELTRDGYPVIAAANPLRSLAGDAAFVAAVLKSIPGPVVLVGHSYGGAVITGAAVGQANVKALVYVDGFMPAPGETALQLSGKFPGSTLGGALSPPVALPGGGQDLYIAPEKFRAQFAADVPLADTRLMAATQRPVTQAALAEPAGPAAWTTIPSWSIYGSGDLNIPPAALAFMSERAKARKTVVVPGASHVAMVSHPKEVAALIEEAAAAK